MSLSMRPLTPSGFAGEVSLLSARIIPGSGGNTEFADMRAAYDALDDDLRPSWQIWLPSIPTSIRGESVTVEQVRVVA